MRQPSRSESGTADVTRDRLLDAAAACFAAHGYAGTSVRDITARAACNVGALTYHFGGKHNAYVAVFEQRLGALARRRVTAMGDLLAAGTPGLEQVVETFATAFLAPLHGNPQGHETMMLLLREMVDGHLPGDLIAARLMRPTLGALASAIDRACPGLAPDALARCCHSLVAQLVHVLQVQRMHERGTAGDVAPADIGATVRHVVCFTCAGILATRAAGAP